MNGLRHPVMVYENMILDGRNRWRACQAAGVEPNIEYLNGGRDPVAYVVSENINRRHLMSSQRAMIAAELSTMRRGGDRKSEKFQCSEPSIDQTEAAKLLKVGRGRNRRVLLRSEAWTSLRNWRWVPFARECVALGGIEAHRQVEGAFRRRQPIRFLVRARAFVLEVKIE
jgi:ParB-like chromosome segregation protein Spo0J